MAYPPANEDLPLYNRVSKLLLDSGSDHSVGLVGIRGFASPPGKNLIGRYDDGIFLCFPGGFIQFNANTDPSREKPGMANLKPGLYLYKLGVHGLSRPAARRYPALVQAAPVVVQRWQAGEERGYFGINIHCGGYTLTGSEGCQTIHPGQWGEFMQAVKDQLNKYEQTVIPYLLVENSA